MGDLASDPHLFTVIDCDTTSNCANNATCELSSLHSVYHSDVAPAARGSPTYSPHSGSDPPLHTDGSCNLPENSSGPTTGHSHQRDPVSTIPIQQTSDLFTPQIGSGYSEDLPLHLCNPVHTDSQIISAISDIIDEFWPSLSPATIKCHPEFSSVYHRVKSFSLPNFLGAKIQVSSALKVGNWIRALTDYHDNELCHFLAFGWPVGYALSKIPTSVQNNHPSALAFPDHVKAYIETECNFDALAGPFNELPFTPWTRILPLMSRPKKDSHQRRIIVDLSYQEGAAVNTGIDTTSYLGQDISYTLPSISDLIAKLQIEGKGAYIWKADLARAYRQLRADPLDAPLLGIQFAGRVYIDRCPPFGCRSSSAACQRVANALVFLMAKKSCHCLAYLDDFTGCSRSYDEASRAYNTFLETTSHLGLQLSLHKCSKPSTSVEWLGYLIDTHAMTVAIPPKKLQEVVQECEKWINRSRVTKSMIQSLLGKLAHISNCVQHGRKFLSRILSTLRAMEKRTWTTIDSEFIKDVKWFLTYAETANGITLYNPATPILVIECDSSLTGGGGNSPTHCYTWTYTKKYMKEYPVIHQLEAINIIVAYRTLAHLRDSRQTQILILTDNISSSWALMSGRTKDTILAACARELWLEAAKNGDTIQIEHRPGVEIPLADALSRMGSDPLKRDYVNTAVAAQQLVFVTPAINNYVFFDSLI